MTCSPVPAGGPGRGADVDVFGIVGDFSHGWQRSFSHEVAGEVARGSRRGWASPKLQCPRAVMRGRVEEHEPCIEMHRVPVKTITMRPGEPGQLEGRGLN